MCLYGIHAGGDILVTCDWEKEVKKLFRFNDILIKCSLVIYQYPSREIVTCNDFKSNVTRNIICKGEIERWNDISLILSFTLDKGLPIEGMLQDWWV